MALGRKTGGRQKGMPNKVTAEIKAAFQKHGDELVEALLVLTKSDDERVRLGAIQAALDRGWGRPAQAVELGGPGGSPVQVEDMTKLKLAMLIGRALQEAAEIKAKRVGELHDRI